MIAIRNSLIPALTAALLLAGCEKFVTGEAVQSVPVSENADGGYGPVRLALAPDMSPVAINFHARHGDDPSELDKWNSYRASLSRNGQTVAIGLFNLNHTGTIDSPRGATYLAQNMLTLNPGEPGDYELVITPTKPVEVKFTGAEVEVRRNVQQTEALRSDQVSTERTPLQ